MFWTGSVSQDWSNPSNWSTTADGQSPALAAPSATDTVCLAASTITNQPVISSAVTVAGVDFTNGAGTATLTSTWGGSFAVSTDGVAAINVLHASGGAIAVAQGVELTVNTFTDEATNITGPGDLVIAQGGSATLTGQYPSITGGATFVNNGTMTLSSTLYQYNASTIVNQGTLVLTGGSDLCNADQSGNVVDNAGLLQSTGTTTIHATIVNDGTVESTSGMLSVLSSLPANTTEAGSWSIDNGATLAFGPNATRTFSGTDTVSGAGTLAIVGTLTATSTSAINVGQVALLGTLSLAKHVNLFQNDPSVEFDVLGGTLVGNGGAVTIAGGAQMNLSQGPISLQSLQVINQGQLTFGPGVTVNASAGLSLRNSDTVTFGPGSKLLTTGSISTSLNNLSNGTVVVNTSAPITVDANVVNAGQVNLGNGVFTIAGLYSQLASGVLNDSIIYTHARLAVPQHSGVLKATSAQLNGTLNPTVTGTPSAGPLFRIVRAATQGTFASVTSGFSLVSDSSGVSVELAGTKVQSSGSTTAIYNSLPQPFTAYSFAFQATSSSEQGQEISFAPGTSRTLSNVVVSMDSWGCESGNWYTPNSCQTTPGATFSEPITLNLYNVNPDGSVGSKITSITQTFDIPYRPSAAAAGTTCGDDTSLGGTTGQEFDENGNCSMGLSVPVTFNTAGVTVPDQVIWSVAYNTSTAGYQPFGTSTPCFSSSGGCGYDSLNVDATLEPTPTVGTNPVAGGEYTNSTWSGDYCDNGSAGVGSFRLDTSNCNTDGNGNYFDLAGEFNVVTAIAPTIKHSAQLSWTAGATSSYQAIASGTPTATFTAQSLPSGLTISASGLVAGSVSRPGTYHFTVTASNAGGSAVEQVTLVVGVPPVFSSPSSVSFTQGVASSFTFTAPGGTITFPSRMVALLPSGCSVTGSTLRCSAAVRHVGTVKFKVAATNAFGTTSEVFTLTIVH